MTTYPAVIQVSLLKRARSLSRFATTCSRPCVHSTARILLDDYISLHTDLGWVDF